MVIYLFLQKNFVQKKKTSLVDFPIGYGAQLAFQATPKVLDKKLLLFSVEACSKSFNP
jgi:hypothetical protein